jgi:enterochelin esterase-like enzyme
MLTTDGIPHEYTEFSGGHSWDYWKEHFAETLRFVDKHSRNKGNQ